MIDLDPRHHAHTGDVDTARTAAAAAMEPRRVTANLVRVMSAHRHHGGLGLTDQELETLIPELGHTATARRVDLKADGLLDDSGMRRLTRKGRHAVAWRITGAGVDWCIRNGVPGWTPAAWDTCPTCGHIR